MRPASRSTSSTPTPSSLRCRVSCRRPRAEDPPPLLTLADVIRRRRRAPDVARLVPHLRLLRAVAVPRPRIEIAELLVQHLVELGEQLDDLVVRIAVIGVDVVAGAVASRSPDQLNVLGAEEVAGALNLRPVLQLEGDVVHADGLAAREVDGVV